MTGIGPGTVLSGRYRLDDLLDDSDGASLWRATDLVLVRDVAIRAVPAGDPRAEGLRDAARTAATVSSMHLLRILDADTESSSGIGDGITYVVTEWSNGDSLATRLSEDVLSPRQAATIVREVAGTIAEAHVHGIAHGRLTPESVHLADNQVKLAGFMVDAVLHGRSGASTGRRALSDGGVSDHESDVRNLGALLYAALTGRWAGSPASILPPAPIEDGKVLHARQVRAGVPTQLDRICDAVLNAPDPETGGHPIETAHEIRSALSDFLGDAVTAMPLTGSSWGDPEATQLGLPPLPGLDSGTSVTSPELVPASVHGGEQVPAPAPYVPSRYGLGSTSEADRAIPDIFAPEQPRPPSREDADGEDDEDWEYWDDGPHWGRWIAGLLAAVVVIAGGYLGVQLLGGGSDSGSPSADGGSKTPATPVALTPAAVKDYDPYAKDPEEHSKQVPLAYDGKPDTAWTTEPYKKGPDIPPLKPGVGLLIDLGSSAEVASVDLTLVGAPSHVALYAVDGDTAPANVDGLTPVADNAAAPAQVTLAAAKPVKARWVIVWFTALPQSGSNYQGGIAEFVVKGTPAKATAATSGTPSGTATKK